jgi:hypothetical protein
MPKIDSFVEIPTIRLVNSKQSAGRGYVLAIGGVASALIVLIVGASTIAAVGHEVPKELWAIGGALSGSLVGILAKSPRARRAGGEATPLSAAQDTIDAANRAAQEQSATEQRVSPAVTQSVAGAVREVERTGEEARQGLVSMSGIGAVAADAQTATLTAATSVAHAQGQKLLDVASEAQGAPADEGLAAALHVHQAAQNAAVATAAVAAAGPDAGWLSGLKAIATEPKLLVPFALFAITVALGILLGLGVIRPVACAPKVLSCSYYAKTTEQTANVMISLASAAVGALIGMFATASPNSTAKAPGGAK